MTIQDIQNSNPWQLALIRFQNDLKHSLWKEINALLKQHFDEKNLTQKDLFRIGELSMLFNCMTNEQLSNIIKEYPLCEQDIQKY